MPNPFPLAGGRLRVAPFILALLLGEVLASPIEDLVTLLAEAPYVRLLPGATYRPAGAAGGILDSGSQVR